jgi:uncharacterized protein YjbI with pentapeptide repeats
MKKQLVERWRDPEFVAEIESTIRGLSIGRQLPTQADIRGIVVRLDGALPELLHADFQGVNLVEVDASYGRFSCSFGHVAATACKFEDAYFDTCRFGRGRFTKCSFVRATLDSAHLDDAIFNECQFEEARIIGRGSNEYGGRRISFTNCNFKSALFQNIQLRATTFQGCTVEGVQFRKCLLAGVKFRDGAPPAEAFQNCEVQSVTVDGNPI